MKVLTILGARPQFIKCAPVSREIRKHFREVILHTGQHYDYNMSQGFFDELAIPAPDYNLGIGSDSHGAQTGMMLMEIEKVLLREKPDLVLVYGDTNSTLAGALAASKLHLPIAHIEAGLRSFNRKMPEEINRIVADKLSRFLFVPTQTAVQNLAREGQTDGVYNVGDVMFDSFLFNLSRLDQTKVLKKFRLQPQQFILATVHRPQNTDNPNVLKALISALEHLHEAIIFPIHPRTRNLMEKYNIQVHADSVHLVEPVSYQEMIALENNARVIITDSGGVQKEAYFAGVPAIVLRGETEWVELVENGWAFLIGDDFQQLSGLLSRRMEKKPASKSLFGDGQASRKIVSVLSTEMESPTH